MPDLNNSKADLADSEEQVRECESDQKLLEEGYRLLRELEEPKTPNYILQLYKRLMG